MLVLDLRRSVRGDQIQSTKRRFCKVGRLPLNHLDCHDAKAPDVDFPTILFPGHNFGRHPIRSSYHGSSFVVRLIDLRTEAKISYDRALAKALR